MATLYRPADTKCRRYWMLNTLSRSNAHAMKGACTKVAHVYLLSSGEVVLSRFKLTREKDFNDRPRWGTFYVENDAK